MNVRNFFKFVTINYTKEPEARVFKSEDCSFHKCPLSEVVENFGDYPIENFTILTEDIDFGGPFFDMNLSDCGTNPKIFRDFIKKTYEAYTPNPIVFKVTKNNKTQTYRSLMELSQCLDDSELESVEITYPETMNGPLMVCLTM